MIQLIAHYLKPALEVLMLWYVFYSTLNFIRGTRAMQVLRALFILLVIFFITQRLELEIITWILNKVFTISVITLLIVFQPELRRGLARLGGGHLIGIYLHEEKTPGELVKALVKLSQNKTGCLIAIQRDTGLKAYAESGAILDSIVSEEIIETVFSPSSPLHDGGLIVEGSRIVAAGCLFPLTANPAISKNLGTRHRAAIGLTEETDALVIIISEENGLISVAEKGRLRRDVDEEGLNNYLREIYHIKERKKRGLSVK